MGENTPNEQTTPKRRHRRNAAKLEMDTFANLVDILRPLTPIQRSRLYNAAVSMLPDGGEPRGTIEGGTR